MPTFTDIQITIKPDSPSAESDSVLRLAKSEIRRLLAFAVHSPISWRNDLNSESKIIKIEATFSTEMASVGEIEDVLAPFMRDKDFILWITWFCNDESKEGCIEITAEKISRIKYEFDSCEDCGFPLQINTDLSPTCDCMAGAIEEGND